MFLFLTKKGCYPNGQHPQQLLRKEPFFVTELAQNVLHKYQVLAAEKNIEINLNMPKNLPMVFADLGLVERVIQHLMDNTLKFTPNK